MRLTQLPESPGEAIVIAHGEEHILKFLLESFGEFHKETVEAHIYQNGKYIEFRDTDTNDTISVYSPIGYQEGASHDTSLDFSFFDSYNLTSMPLNCRRVGITSDGFQIESSIYDQHSNKLYLYINADGIKINNTEDVYLPNENGIFEIEHALEELPIITSILYESKPQYRIRYLNSGGAKLKVDDIDNISAILAANSQEPMPMYEIRRSFLQDIPSGCCHMEVL